MGLGVRRGTISCSELKVVSLLTPFLFFTARSEKVFLAMARAIFILRASIKTRTLPRFVINRIFACSATSFHLNFVSCTRLKSGNVCTDRSSCTNSILTMSLVRSLPVRFQNKHVFLAIGGNHSFHGTSLLYSLIDFVFPKSTRTGNRMKTTKTKEDHHSNSDCGQHG